MFGLWQNTGTYSIHYTDISLEILKYYEDSKLDFINHKTLELWKIDSLVKSEGIVTKKGFEREYAIVYKIKIRIPTIGIIFFIGILYATPVWIDLAQHCFRFDCKTFSSYPLLFKLLKPNFSNSSPSLGLIYLFVENLCLIFLFVEILVTVCY